MFIVYLSQRVAMPKQNFFAHTYNMSFPLRSQLVALKATSISMGFMWKSHFHSNCHSNHHRHHREALVDRCVTPLWPRWIQASNVTFRRRSRSGSTRSFGVRRHLTSVFRPVERFVCIHRAWCTVQENLG